MRLTVKGLRQALTRGGVWLLLVSQSEFKIILRQLEDRNIDIHAMQCDTVEDAVKLKLLIEAFNTWNLEGIRNFIKSNPNYPKINEEDY